MFTTWKDADIYPVLGDALIGVINFKDLFGFVDMGSQYIPISFYSANRFVFSQRFSEYPWIAIPTNDEIEAVAVKLPLNYLEARYDGLKKEIEHLDKSKV